MARVRNGIIAGLRGVIGQMEVYEVKGHVYARLRRQKTKKAPSAKQLACRARMQTVSEFLNPLTPFLKVGYAAIAKKSRGSTYNAAVSYNMKNAVDENGLHYERTRVAEGPISNYGLNAKVKWKDNKLVFTWDQNGEDSDDQVMLLAYCHYSHVVYNLEGATRDKGKDILAIDEKDHYLVYISFVSKDRKRCSNSVYLGEIRCL